MKITKKEKKLISDQHKKLAKILEPIGFKSAEPCYFFLPGVSMQALNLMSADPKCLGYAIYKAFKIDIERKAREDYARDIRDMLRPLLPLQREGR